MNALDVNQKTWQVAVPQEKPAAVRQHAAHERAEARMRTGNILVIAGFAIMVTGIVLYCAACFAGGMNQDLAAILFENVVPFARATLAVLGLGTLVWIIGSFMYLSGAMDADIDDTSDQ